MQIQFEVLNVAQPVGGAPGVAVRYALRAQPSQAAAGTALVNGTLQLGLVGKDIGLQRGDTIIATLIKADGTEL